MKPKTVGFQTPNNSPDRGDLQAAFLEGIEAVYRSRFTDLNPTVLVGGETEMSLHDLCGKLWQCTDIMPGGDADLLDLPGRRTYAAAARHLRESMAEARLVA